MTRLCGAVLLAVAAAAAGCAEPNPDRDKKQTAGGVEYEDLKVGTGREARRGNQVKVHYTGWLAENNRKFDSSLDDGGKPIDFILKTGEGGVIRGWVEGVAGMKVGGKRKLYIPSRLGYGVGGSGAAIPPNADLVFEVELLDVEDAPSAAAQ